MKANPIACLCFIPLNQSCTHILVQLAAVVNYVTGVNPAQESLELDLFQLQRFVILEESLNCLEPVLRQLRDVVVVAVFEIVGMDRDDLIVLLVLVNHLHRADGLGTN